MVNVRSKTDPNKIDKVPAAGVGNVPTFKEDGGLEDSGGPPLKRHVHTQSVADTVWVVQHNLNDAGRPPVSVTNESGVVVGCGVQYVNANRVVVNFTVPVAGVATVG